jgi:hypothetical protein
MFGSGLLDIIIGLVFIYWLLSLLCSGINETISSIVSMRAKDLEKAIRNLLDDPKGTALANSLYSHSLIRTLSKEGKNPSYIPSRTFALALMDMIAPSSLSSHTKNAEEIREVVRKIQDDRLRQTLLVLAEDAGSEINKLRDNIERWFNDAMERVSGWYKRKVQTIIAILAILVSTALNADTFMITKYLINNEPMRTAVVEAAREAIKKPIPSGQVSPGSEEKMEAAPLSTAETSLQKIEYVQKELQKLPLPLGWYEVPKEFEDWVMKLLGILFTAIAVSLGAPFWFDFLDKILKIRPGQSGKRPENASQKC